MKLRTRPDRRAGRDPWVGVCWALHESRHRGIEPTRLRELRTAVREASDLDDLIARTQAFAQTGRSSGVQPKAWQARGWRAVDAWLDGSTTGQGISHDALAGLVEAPRDALGEPRRALAARQVREKRVVGSVYPEDTDAGVTLQRLGGLTGDARLGVFGTRGLWTSPFVMRSRLGWYRISAERGERLWK